MPRTKKTAEKATEKKVEAVETKTKKTRSSAPEKVEIKGVHGNEYGKNQGMKGKDLYGELLQKHIA